MAREKGTRRLWRCPRCRAQMKQLKMFTSIQLVCNNEACGYELDLRDHPHYAGE